MIQECKNKCQHQVQDKHHGDGKRVMNVTASMNGAKRIVRCTVCATEQDERTHS